ncbi:hypothetical protein RHMOL_Rhmol02G0152500 [Rhododendron molle]|uniref:Uncharacterized protein n=1 Tax=Rhododendron molle TaxID=49168 RepID=A0ACC0PRZ9_RHOML|nr:hypothetical protein RHMOL_Rhmol02G0152500 [Rhododendron molle]
MRGDSPSNPPNVAAICRRPSPAILAGRLLPSPSPLFSSLPFPTAAHLSPASLLSRRLLIHCLSKPSRHHRSPTTGSPRRPIVFLLSSFLITLSPLCFPYFVGDFSSFRSKFITRTSGPIPKLVYSNFKFLSTSLFSTRQSQPIHGEDCGSEVRLYEAGMIQMGKSTLYFLSCHMKSGLSRAEEVAIMQRQQLSLAIILRSSCNNFKNAMQQLTPKVRLAIVQGHGSSPSNVVIINKDH